LKNLGNDGKAAKDPTDKGLKDALLNDDDDDTIKKADKLAKEQADKDSKDKNGKDG